MKPNMFIILFSLALLVAFISNRSKEAAVNIPKENIVQMEAFQVNGFGGSTSATSPVVLDLYNECNLDLDLNSCCLEPRSETLNYDLKICVCKECANECSDICQCNGG